MHDQAVEEIQQSRKGEQNGKQREDGAASDEDTELCEQLVG